MMNQIDQMNQMNQQSKINLKPTWLQGVVHVPPSKSIFHRILVCSALAEWMANSSIKDDLQDEYDFIETPRFERYIQGFPCASLQQEDLRFNHAHLSAADQDNTLILSDDIRATYTCLNQLFKAHIDRAPSPLVLDCGESGTTLRFLIPIVAAIGIPTTFIGHGRLPKRPIDAYVTAYADTPVCLSKDESDTLPCTVHGQFEGGFIKIKGDVSSQYISGLLLAAPLTRNGLHLELLTPLTSRPYVDLTVDAMRLFGIEVDFDESMGIFGGYHVASGQRYQRPFKPVQIEGDYSNAAFWLILQHLGFDITIQGLNLQSAQGDRVVMDQLQAIERLKTQGASLNWTISMRDIPDVAPVLAMLFAHTDGVFTLTDVQRLTVKECDRLAAIKSLLDYLHVNYLHDQAADTLCIYGSHCPKSLEGEPPSCMHDHRMVMTQVVTAHMRWLLGASLSDWSIDHPQSVQKSYPDFWRIYTQLGGQFEVC